MHEKKLLWNSSRVHEAKQSAKQLAKASSEEVSLADTPSTNRTTTLAAVGPSLFGFVD